jgi:8-oxo-dGTP pyrophosphatase MutT (NUDIX family)
MEPRPAATITVLRDTERGLEVLMLKRNLNSVFVPGVHIFPGGTLDEADHEPGLHALCDGPDDLVASRILGIERGGLAYWIAAIRELFEEAGLLLARRSGGVLLELTEAGAAERFSAHRKRMDSGEEPFNAVVTEEKLRLATDRLRYFGHWITPLGAVRRYDTRFFVAVAPEHQVVEHDNREAIAHEWVRPADIIERHRRGECQLRTPTLHTLQRFGRFDATPALFAAVDAEHRIPAITPRITREGRLVLPGEPGYDEAATPEGRGEWTARKR